MQAIGMLLTAVGGITSLVCFILVLVKMFQNGKTGLGIACIVLAFCCGIGSLVGYIYGWMKSGEWNLKNVMLVWTAGIVLYVVGSVMNPVDFSQIQKQIEQQQHAR
jgi:hypothetical protein